jgi:hypothetical protein
MKYWLDLLPLTRGNVSKRMALAFGFSSKASQSGFTSVFMIVLRAILANYFDEYCAVV